MKDKRDFGTMVVSSESEGSSVCPPYPSSDDGDARRNADDDNDDDDDDVEIIPCGSYRRGAMNCSDLDVVLSFADPRRRLVGDELERLLAEFRLETGVLLEDLASSSSATQFFFSSDEDEGGQATAPLRMKEEETTTIGAQDEDRQDQRCRRTPPTSRRGRRSGGRGRTGGKELIKAFLGAHSQNGDSSDNGDRGEHYLTWQGVCRPGAGKLFRRVDMVFCARRELPFLLIQWTGSSLFKREMSRVAAYRSMHLGTTALCEVEREAPKGQNVGQVLRVLRSVPCSSEEEIFDALGLRYRKLELRELNVEFLAEVTAAKEECANQAAARPGGGSGTVKLETKVETKVETKLK